MAKPSEQKVVSESDAILALQRSYAEAVLARGNLPPEIISKYERMQELSTKAGSPETIRQMAEIAAELLPYFHFKMDDVNWTKQ